MSKKLEHGFPDNTKLLEKINKDILKLFKNHVEWEKYEKSVVYPIWNNSKALAGGNDKEFDQWSAKMKKELMKRGEKPTVKPKIDFDTSGTVTTKNDFSKLSTVSYLESAQKSFGSIIESIDGNFHKATFESHIGILIDDLANIDPSDPQSQVLMNQINTKLSEWEDIRNYG